MVLQIDPTKGNTLPVIYDRSDITCTNLQMLFAGRYTSVVKFKLDGITSCGLVLAEVHQDIDFNINY